MKDGIHGQGTIPGELTVTRLLRELRQKHLKKTDDKTHIYEVTKDFYLGKEVENQHLGKDAMNQWKIVAMMI